MSAYLVDHGKINEIVTHLKHTDHLDMAGEYPERLLAQAMVDLNTKGVNLRYNEQAEPELITYRSTMPITTNRAYRLLGEYLYQCAQGSCRETDLYKMLEGIFDDLAHEIAREVVYK